MRYGEGSARIVEQRLLLVVSRLMEFYSYRNLCAGYSFAKDFSKSSIHCFSIFTLSMDPVVSTTLL